MFQGLWHWLTQSTVIMLELGTFSYIYIYIYIYIYNQCFGSFYHETWRFEENRNWQDRELTGKLVLQ